MADGGYILHVDQWAPGRTVAENGDLAGSKAPATKSFSTRSSRRRSPPASRGEPQAGDLKAFTGKGFQRFFGIYFRPGVGSPADQGGLDAGASSALPYTLQLEAKINLRTLLTVSSWQYFKLAR